MIEISIDAVTYLANKGSEGEAGTYLIRRKDRLIGKFQGAEEDGYITFVYQDTDIKVGDELEREHFMEPFDVRKLEIVHFQGKPELLRVYW